MRKVFQIFLLTVCMMTLSQEAHCQKSRMVKKIIDFVFDYGNDIYSIGKSAYDIVHTLSDSPEYNKPQGIHYTLPKFTLPTIRTAQYVSPKYRKSSLYSVYDRFRFPISQLPQRFVPSISGASRPAYQNIATKTDFNVLIAKFRYQQWGAKVPTVYISLPNLLIIGEDGRISLQ